MDFCLRFSLGFWVVWFSLVALFWVFAGLLFGLAAFEFVDLDVVLFGF